MAASLAATDLTRVKAYIDETGSGLDDQLEAWIAVVSVAIERYLNRPLLKAARVEIMPTVRQFQRFIVVDAPPIDTTVAVVIKEASDRDFDAATALETTVFHVDGPAGLIHLDGALNDSGCGRDQHGTVRTGYTGGLATTVDGLDTAYPEIVQAANIEVQARYDGRNRLGKAAESMGGASVTLLDEHEKPLCAQARSLLDPLRRRRLRG